MKICFLAPFGIRPKGTVIARMLPLAAELQAMGHTVTIIAPPYTNPEDSGKIEKVRGVRLVNVELPSCSKTAGALLIAWRMFLTLRTEQPSLVHLFKPKGYGGLTAIFILLLKKIGIHLPPLFVDTDDWEGSGGMNDLHSYSTAEKRLFAFQEQWLSKHANGVTVASLTLERLTMDMGIPKERILYLPNCVEAKPPGDKAFSRTKLGIAADVPVLLLYTRFFEFTQDRLYLLLAEISRQIPGVKILVAGKGNNCEEKLLHEAAAEKGFGDALLMAGWLDPEVISDYFAAADVAIYPLDNTLTNRAKCPAKLAELLAAGVPVVADAVGQATEYIKAGNPDLICRPGDWREMAASVVGLLNDNERRIVLGEASRIFILEQYSWRKFAILLSKFYSANK